MKIVADENIPLVDYYFKPLGELLLKPGRSITSTDVKDADILLVRSVTPVNEKLLQDAHIHFIGSTTTGFDHLDLDYLEAQHIPWAIAKGCNSMAVVDYVLSIIAALEKQNYFNNKQKRAAVIGVGQIGTIVSRLLRVLDFEVLECDPIRAEEDPTFHSTDLAAIEDVDLITLHTPLTHQGKYPTYHMIEKQFLQRQKQHCVLLNTSRGSVVHFEDLKKYGTHLTWCLDVWENEPQIDQTILQKALIATPHIAGYSIQSKLRGIEMVYSAALDQNIIANQSIEPLYPEKIVTLPDNTVGWQDVILTAVDPIEMTRVTKQTLAAQPNQFDELRKKFSGRYEIGFIQFENIKLSGNDLVTFNEIMKIIR